VTIHGAMALFGGRIAIANTRYTYRLGNVQPDLSPLLEREDVVVLVFVGARQSKLPFALIDAVQKMGGRANYVHLSQAGRNALDMHIALYLGRMLQSYPNARFHVISKDRGYEPLLSHINLCDRRASLWADLSKLPEPQKSSKTGTKHTDSPQSDAPQGDVWSNQRPASIIMKRSSQNSSTKTIRMLAL